MRRTRTGTDVYNQVLRLHLHFYERWEEVKRRARTHTEQDVPNTIVVEKSIVQHKGALRTRPDPVKHAKDVRMALATVARKLIKMLVPGQEQARVALLARCSEEMVALAEGRLYGRSVCGTGSGSGGSGNNNNNNNNNNNHGEGEAALPDYLTTHDEDIIMNHFRTLVKTALTNSPPPPPPAATTAATTTTTTSTTGTPAAPTATTTTTVVGDETKKRLLLRLEKLLLSLLAKKSISRTKWVGQTIVYLDYAHSAHGILRTGIIVDAVPREKSTTNAALWRGNGEKNDGKKNDGKDKRPKKRMKSSSSTTSTSSSTSTSTTDGPFVVETMGQRRVMNLWTKPTLAVAADLGACFPLMYNVDWCFEATCETFKTNIRKSLTPAALVKRTTKQRNAESDGTFFWEGTGGSSMDQERLNELGRDRLGCRYYGKREEGKRGRGEEERMWCEEVV